MVESPLLMVQSANYHSEIASGEGTSKVPALISSLPSGTHFLIKKHAEVPKMGGPFIQNYPLVIQHSYWKWQSIVDLPIENGGSFHSYVGLPKGRPFCIKKTWWLWGYLILPGRFKAFSAAWVWGWLSQSLETKKVTSLSSYSCIHLSISLSMCLFAYLLILNYTEGVHEIEVILVSQIGWNNSNLWGTQYMELL